MYFKDAPGIRYLVSVARDKGCTVGWRHLIAIYITGYGHNARC